MATRLTAGMIVSATIFATAIGNVAASEPAAAAVADLTQLSLDELVAIKVTSVSRRPEDWSKTPAAIHVITRDDLRRSGVTSVPDALRLVPGVHVARINSNQWALGIRGFTSRLARAQLALIDGRSVYTPLFGGTYWEVQDTLLEDVDRVEVVRGPGGTLWGANAVTGIVNVTTKNARDTQGGLLAVAGGNEDRALVRARYGGRLGGGHFRVYGKYSNRDAAFHAVGPEFDDWTSWQGGVRADWGSSDGDTWTIQGDAYRTRAGQRVAFGTYEPPYTEVAIGHAPLSGGNVLGAWTHTMPGGRRLALRAYFDRTQRDEASFRETRDTMDADLQYDLGRFGPHAFVAGAGYRVSEGRTAGVETVSFDPADKTDHLVSAFVEDRVSLVRDRVELSLGTKVVHNDYTGAELQPSARILWTPAERHTVWAAATRAVRTPSRLDTELALTTSLTPAAPLFARLVGSPDYDAERSWIYEAGYRVRPSSRVALSIAAFYNRYPNLTSLEPGVPFAEDGRQIVPYVFDNLLTADVGGFEVVGYAQLTDRWRVRADYAFLNMDVRPQPESRDNTSSVAEDASPRHRVFLWSSWDVLPTLEVDARLRWVARLPSQGVEAYATLTARVSWQATPALELALCGTNLLSPHHAEFGGGAEVERAAFAEARWRF